MFWCWVDHKGNGNQLPLLSEVNESISWSYFFAFPLSFAGSSFGRNYLHLSNYQNLIKSHCCCCSRRGIESDVRYRIDIVKAICCHHPFPGPGNGVELRQEKLSPSSRWLFNVRRGWNWISQQQRLTTTTNPSSSGLLLLRKYAEFLSPRRREMCQSKIGGDLHNTPLNKVLLPICVEGLRQPIHWAVEEEEEEEGLV